MVGRDVSHYRVLSTLGRGGMGVVYLAEDLKLHRKVALKFIGEPDAGGDARLLREAQTASALDHPNIATVYEIGDWEGRQFIAMAYYEGQTLRARIEDGPLSIAEARRIAWQIASGLAAAHAAGVVHRDLKPANVLLTSSGQVKILDFGLAKHVSAPDTETLTQLTAAGTTMGTLAYMSPEQASGTEVESAADVWALGVVVYEMLTGRRPFDATTPAATLLAIVSTDPQPAEQIRPETPPELGAIVTRALIKDSTRRTITASDIALALAPSGETTAIHVTARPRWSRGATAAAVAATVAVAVAGGWAVREYMRSRWVAQVAIPDIRRLVGNSKNVEAFLLARRARAISPQDRELADLWRDLTRRASFTTTPAGAAVSIGAIGSADWLALGATPLSNIEIPTGILRTKIEKAGYRTAEDLVAGLIPASFTLVQEDAGPPGMVRGAAAPRGTRVYLLPGADPVPIEYNAFWLDRTEVTNRAYKAFVDAGGYRAREFWKTHFVRGSETMSWDEAMPLLVDATGRPGPATWQGGTYPDGQDEYPVRGVNWYEASAYASFAGKRLPTLVHWRNMSAQYAIAEVLPLANMGASGPAPVGRSGALGRGGSVDLLGNVKEWVVNSAGGNLRYSLGGSWDEPPYMAVEPDARDAFERAANFGFRCARFDPGDKSVDALSGVLERPSRDYRAEAAVDDRVFDAYKRFYAYDRIDIKATVASRDDTPGDWVVEMVTFPASYGAESITARVFIPKRTEPPFQALVYVPGAGQFALRTSTADTDIRIFGHIVRSGRLVIFPMLKGAYERGTPQFTPDTPKDGAQWRDYAVAWHKDLARTIDYLQSRPDVDPSRIGYLGQSRGAAIAPITLALEPRIKAAALLIPGFYLARPAPEVDVFNFAPRVRQPLLMLSGRYDYIFPEHRSQLPFFDGVGTPAEHKKRLVYDTGHNLPPLQMMRETLAWFDQHLGPVKR